MLEPTDTDSVIRILGSLLIAIMPLSSGFAQSQPQPTKNAEVTLVYQR